MNFFIFLLLEQAKKDNEECIEGLSSNLEGTIEEQIEFPVQRQRQMKMYGFFVS